MTCVAAAVVAASFVLTVRMSYTAAFEQVAVNAALRKLHAPLQLLGHCIGAAVLSLGVLCC